MDPSLDDDKVVAAYRKGVAKGMLKVMAKMGISTLQSYKGAQIFEALGLRDEIIQKCFVGTASRIQGVSFDVIAEETLRRHKLGYPDRIGDRMTATAQLGRVSLAGRRGKACLVPTVDFQPSSRRSQQRPRRILEICSHDQRRQPLPMHPPWFARFQDVDDSQSIHLDEVEPASEIVKRFCTGAMSFGSISAESHETLAIAMNRLGGKSNTGEGGEDPLRFQPLENGDSKRSAIKQVASGRFGVTIEYLTNADETANQDFAGSETRRRGRTARKKGR